MAKLPYLGCIQMLIVQNSSLHSQNDLRNCFTLGLFCLLLELIMKNNISFPGNYPVTDQFSYTA